MTSHFENALLYWKAIWNVECQTFLYSQKNLFSSEYQFRLSCHHKPTIGVVLNKTPNLVHYLGWCQKHEHNFLQEVAGCPTNRYFWVVTVCFKFLTVCFPTSQLQQKEFLNLQMPCPRFFLNGIVLPEVLADYGTCILGKVWRLFQCQISTNLQAQTYRRLQTLFQNS